MIHRSASKTPVRRKQLITPFGVGALITNQEGVSMICASLDHWFGQDDLDLSEFRSNRDRRLLDRLLVDHLRTPPDYREPNSLADSEENLGLSIPAFRFPQWHYCPKCRSMKKRPLTVRGRQTCKSCGEKKGGNWYGPPLYQLRFVAACDHGHLQDFPWREWAHRDPDPECEEELEFKSKGGSTLASVSVGCGCGAWRNLGGVTRAYASGQKTVLSEQLYDDGRFLCDGKKPWTGFEQGEDCARPLRATLRNASNLYFADTVSSLFLPPEDDEIAEQLVPELRKERYSMVISLLRSKESPSYEERARELKRSYQTELQDYEPSEIEGALRIVLESDGEENGTGGNDDTPEETGEIAYRRQEFLALREPRRSENLTIRDEGLEKYSDFVQNVFSRITLVERLQETRVLTGLTRLTPDIGEDSPDGRRLLWREGPDTSGWGSWLPASLTHGEGIFLEFDEETVSEWEQVDSVKDRIAPLQQRYEQSRYYDEGRTITPRFVLVHTFSHLLINRLVFECGYSTAALGERLYVSDREDTRMAGVLIYTAAGDADGTMGGLVRMGKPGYLEPVIENALSEAEWCSADPICMEAAEEGGQGPESLNLAACHNCALTPETSCEEFNHFLDRGMVIGFGEEANQNGLFEDALTS